MVKQGEKQVKGQKELDESVKDAEDELLKMKSGNDEEPEEEDWCSICNEKYEEKTNEEELWIECEKCFHWFHTNCVGINRYLIPDIFVCSTCEDL